MLLTTALSRFYQRRKKHAVATSTGDSGYTDEVIDTKKSGVDVSEIRQP